jgi:hypothetical protein
MSIAISPQYLLFYIPLLAAISLVIAGTRHERTDLIVRQAWHTALWISGFLGIIAAVMGLSAWWGA